jgi:hypothetical protein
LTVIGLPAATLASPLTPSISVVVSASSVGGCESDQSTISPGVQISASCSGNLGQAEADLAFGGVATASAVSSNPDSGTFGGSGIVYNFALVPNGAAGGPSVPSNGIPITIAASASVTFSTPPGLISPSDAGSASVYVGGDVEFAQYVLQASFNPNDGCLNAAAPPCLGSYRTSILPNSEGSMVLLASCDIVGVASCSAEADPKITIGSAYAPYYKVVDFLPVPLPATLPLLGLALAGFVAVGGIRWRKGT